MNKNNPYKTYIKSPLKPKILILLKRNVYIDMIYILPEKIKTLTYQGSVMRASKNSKCYQTAGRRGTGLFDEMEM